MRYPSRTGGESYTLPLDIYNRQGVENKWDSGRVLLGGQPSVFEFVDTGIIDLSDNTDVRMYIATSTGYKTTPIETDHSKLLLSRFMQSIKDWHNVEFTICFKYTGGFDGGKITLGARGGLQESPCEGFAYKAILNLIPTSGSLSKQQYYPSGNAPRNFTTSKLGTTIKDKFVCLKLCIYDVDADEEPTLDKTVAVGVRVEFYGTLEGGTFKLLSQTLDNGDWNSIAACGGDGTEAGLWGGPLTFVQWGKGAAIQIKSLTVREIDPTKDFDSLGHGSQSFPPIASETPEDDSTNNESPNDDYGVKKIYQTNASGTHWYPPIAGITSDDRFDDNGADVTNHGDGTYTVEGKSRMLVYSTKARKQSGEDYEFATYDFSKLQTKGFWDASTDYRDIEVTMYINCKTLTGTADEFSIVTRSVRHEEKNHNGCGGSSYHGSLRFTDGAARLIKEPRHVDYTDYKTSTQKLGNIIGKKVGFKFICYNKSSTSVQNEIWLDKNADNNWTQYIEYLDVGEWSEGSDEGMSPCGGLSKGAAITWGSTKLIFKDNGLDIDFTKLSIRSITGTLMGDVTPTTGGSGQLSRVFSKYTMRYNIIVDTSGVTCAGQAGGGGGAYVEITGLTVSTINSDKEIGGDAIPSAEDGRTTVGWYCNASDALIKGKKPRKVECYLQKVGSPTGNAEMILFDNSGNQIVSYGTIDVSTLATSYGALKTFTNDNAPASMPNGILQDWTLGVKYTGATTDNYVEVGINTNNPVDSTKTCEWQYEREPGPGYSVVKNTGRDMCGKLWT